MVADVVSTSSASRDPLPDILPRHSLNLLAAASGVGKTALLATIMRQLTRRAPVFGVTPGEITAVGYISTDRPWTTDSKLWFEAAGVPDMRHYSLVEDRSFQTSRLRNKLGRVLIFEECLGKLNLPPGGLVIVDPIALFLGGNLLDYDICAIACIDIQRILAQRDITAIATVHSAKQKADTKDRYLRPQDRILGSMALLGYSSTQMYLASPEECGDDAGYYQFSWNPHHAPPAVFSLKRLANGLFEHSSPYEVTEVRVEAQPLEALPERARAVYGQLPAYPGLLPREGVLAACAELGSQKTVYRMLEVLQRAGHVVNPKRGHWGRAPEQLH